MALRIIGLALLIALVSLGVIYQQEIMDYSQLLTLERESARDIQRGDWPCVIYRFEVGLRQQPQNIPLAMKLADFYGNKKDYAKAEYIYKQVLRYQPKNFTALKGMGESLAHALNSQNQALRYYKRALRIQPQNVMLLADLGNLYKEAGENPDENRPKTKKWLNSWAVYYYRQALAHAPDQSQIRFNLGVVYQHLDKADQAALEYCHALEKYPDSYEAHYNLGLSLVDMKLYDDGFRELSRAVQILGEENHMPEAQALAQQTQYVKNLYFNLESNPNDTVRKPAWLPFCLGGKNDKSK